jgi:hypothetical protein
LPGPRKETSFEPPFYFGISLPERNAEGIAMTDTAITTVTGHGDPDPAELDRLAASLDALTLSFCESSADNVGKRSVGEGQQLNLQTAL